MDELDERIKAVAEWCLQRNISVVPIGQDKKPAIAWGPLIDEPLKEWAYPGCNLALITGETNGVSIIDCDNMDAAIWWRNNRPKTPMMVRTKRGVHFYYQHPADTYIKSDSGIVVEGDIKVDAKCSRSFCLMPPSYRSGHQYQIIINDDNPRGVWVDPRALPMFDPAWRPERPRKEWDDSQGIKDMRAYMSKVFAIEGQQGDKTTFRMACVMSENNIPEADAIALMCEWNETNCNPKWSVSEIVRKTRLAYS